MTRRLVGQCLTLAVLGIGLARGDDAKGATQPPPVSLTAEQDHQRTMDLLHIGSLRRGADGDPNSANAANYDESKANPYPTLPDPLRLKNGKEVRTADQWWKRRRPEIVEDFDREIYGRVPKITPKVNWEVINTANDLPVDSHELIALCAPRPVFISGGAMQGDGWVDARGMFMAAAAAGPVYKLLGRKDMGTTQFPSLETPLSDGDIAFRQHSGGHMPGPNWPTFLTFASRYLKTPRKAATSDATRAVAPRTIQSRP